MGQSVNGKPLDSKSRTEGSIPSWPAKKGEKEMKKVFIFVVISLLMANMAWAGYIGNYSGNDSKSSVSFNLQEWFSNPAQGYITEDDNWDWGTFFLYDKNELNVSGTNVFDNTSDNGLLTITGTLNNENELKSGSFFTNDNIRFYSLKSGNGYDLYWLESLGSNVNWSTSKGLSHISAWNVGESQVPIPGALWLFGTGLLGLLGFKRKKVK